MVGTGDITDRGTPAEFRLALKALGEIGLPFRLIPGNHDHYGHEDEPRPADEPLKHRELGAGTFTRWEEVMGPRWWSMNAGGLHLVGLDWFSARIGADRRQQLSWLSGDLALVPCGQPVILLSHGQPDSAFFNEVRRESPAIKLVAVLSGHRHGPSAVKLNETLHLSTAPALVPGRDCSPPQIRVVDWNGSELTTQTVVPAGSTPPRFRSAPPRWAFESRVGSGHSVCLAPHPLGLVATTADHDRATSRITLMDGGSGKTRWSWQGSQPIASAATVGPEGEVYTQSSAGTSARIDDGRLTWMIESPDALTSRVRCSPLLTGDGGVIVQGPGFVRCLKCTDGRVRWTRPVGDAGVHDSSAGGCVCNGLAVLALAGPGRGLTVLNLAGGSVVWADHASTPPPASAPAELPDGTMVVVRQDGGVQRFEPATGRIRWSASLGRRASAAAPVVIDELVLIVTADAAVHILDSKTGWILREHRLGRAAEDGAAGDIVAAAVARVRNVLHVITVSGEWWRLDPYHWEPELVASLPVSVTSPPIEVGPNLVIPGREGLVLAADSRTWPEHRRNRDRGTTPASGPGRARRRAADRWLGLH